MSPQMYLVECVLPKIGILFAQSMAIDVVAELAARGFPVKLTATPLPEEDSRDRA